MTGLTLVQTPPDIYFYIVTHLVNYFIHNSPFTRVIMYMSLSDDFYIMAKPGVCFNKQINLITPAHLIFDKTVSARFVIMKNFV